MKAENCNFFTPLSFGDPVAVSPSEFRSEVNREETRVTGLSSREDRMIELF